jgi:hypothetical protein
VVPGILRGPACRFFATRLMRVPDRFARLDSLVEKEIRSGEFLHAQA